jgi:hypothetical protein
MQPAAGATREVGSIEPVVAVRASLQAQLAGWGGLHIPGPFREMLARLHGILFAVGFSAAAEVAGGIHDQPLGQAPQPWRGEGL